MAKKRVVTFKHNGQIEQAVISKKRNGSLVIEVSADAGERIIEFAKTWFHGKEQ